jgi:ferredoxin--NADP+ reductase
MDTALLDRPLPADVSAERVTAVEHYTDRLFRFRTTRPASLRFRSGEFVMIGLPHALHNGKPVFRAYSIASPSWDEELEFFSIKVPGGPLTEHLQRVRPGDMVLVRRRPTGTLVVDALLPGRRLFLFATGTGVAPFASILRDPETFERFDEVVLVETCREVAELAYARQVVDGLADDPLVGEFAGRVRLYDSATREPHVREGRITALLSSGRLFADLGIDAIDPAQDRAMICGSLAMLRDVAAMLEALGLGEGSNNRPATYVVERAFAG